MHPLDGAHERVNRASEHLVNLKGRIEILRIEKRESVLHEYNPILANLRQSKRWGNIKTWNVNPGTEPILGVLVGEVIYNLRAALDYLVYELAQFDSKQIVQHTQFPIEDRVDSFIGRISYTQMSQKRRRKDIWLCGINDFHVALISRYQPCYGCDWTKVLRDISDPDKHRTLTTIFSPIRLSYVGEAASATQYMAMGMNYDVSISVIFADRTPVIETLEQLRSQVSETIDAFDSEFE